MTQPMLVPGNLDILRIRAAQGDSGEHLKWTLDVSNGFLDDEKTIRVVIGTLHAGGSHGWADISVGAFFLGTPEAPFETISGLIQGSMAAETLYDFARSHLAPQLALVGSEFKLPRKSPDAEIVGFDDEEDDEDGSDASAVPAGTLAL